jgi:hypothetical protein
VLWIWRHGLRGCDAVYLVDNCWSLRGIYSIHLHVRRLRQQVHIKPNAMSLIMFQPHCMQRQIAESLWTIKLKANGKNYVELKCIIWLFLCLLPKYLKTVINSSPSSRWSQIWTCITFFPWVLAPSGTRPPHNRGFTITLRHTIIGRTSLDEWSVRHRDLYLTTHNTHKGRHPCLRRNSNQQSQQVNGRRPPS